jgi:hypothetical protein
MKNRVDFIDWLKAIGMFLIVFGHYFGEPFGQFTQPVYFKQLGVAFFVFVMGWGLANETRPHWQVLYNRIFPMYFWGLAIALFISVIFIFTKGPPALSNYLPFFAGITVLGNFFPSNPTTWFIGTYFHLLLLWVFLLRKIRITLPLLLLVSLTECLIRSFWIDIDRLYTGYMLFTNWTSILMLGMYMHQQRDIKNLNKAFFNLVLWSVFLLVWAFIFNSLNLTLTFPFKTISLWGDLTNSLFISAAVTLIYLGNTLMAVRLYSHIPSNRLVRFFSRNTIIIFIGHMPLYDLAEPIARIFVESGWGKRAIIVFIMYVGLAIVSELLHKIADINKLKMKLWSRLN